MGSMKRSSRSSTTNPTWPYFGIDEVAMMVDPNEKGMLVSGINSPEGEQCLVVKGEEGTKVGMENCTDVNGAKEYTHIWRFNEDGQLEQDNGLCMMVATTEVKSPAGAPVAMGECQSALNQGDGHSLWELTEDNQLRLSRPE